MVPVAGLGASALAQHSARGSAGPSVPKTPAEREKMLSDLYAHLATAGDEDSAKAVAEAIERVWVNSGSDTIDVLMERSMKAVGEKNYDLGLKLLDHVVALAPDFTEGWNRRAYVHYMRARSIWRWAICAARWRSIPTTSRRSTAWARSCARSARSDRR